MATEEEINRVWCNLVTGSGGGGQPEEKPAATREEILELVEIAKIKALPLARIEGGGAAFRSILELADSVAALAMLVEIRDPETLPPPDDDTVVVERRRNPEGRRHIDDRRRKPQK